VARPHPVGQPVAGSPKMRKAALVLSVGGLAVLVAGLLAGRAPLPPAPETDAASAQAWNDPPITREPARTTPAGNEPRARAVAPNVVAIPPVEPRMLVRVEPREPLSPFARPLPPPKRDNSRIYRPIADAAGRILGSGLLVDIAGVEVVEPEESCIDTDGIEWPCGMRARTAFRGFLRGRAVTCDVPPDFEGTEIATQCSLGKMDLGGWIVANGWGRASPGGPYEEKEQLAREAEKGIFGQSPAPAPIFTTPLPDFLNPPARDLFSDG
jgi:endonuclease YncB( thermonuclease family)